MHNSCSNLLQFNERYSQVQKQPYTTVINDISPKTLRSKLAFGACYIHCHQIMIVHIVILIVILIFYHPDHHHHKK